MKGFEGYGFPCGSAGKECACNAGDLGSIPELVRSLGEGRGCPLQYSGLDNSMDCIVPGVANSRTRLSDFRFQYYFGFYRWGNQASERLSTLLKSPNSKGVYGAHVELSKSSTAPSLWSTRQVPSPGSRSQNLVCDWLAKPHTRRAIPTQRGRRFLI